MRRILSRVLLPAACAVFAAAAPAAARAQEPVADPQVAAWITVAEAYWRAAPSAQQCPNGVSVIREQWLEPAVMVAASDVGGCVIALDPRWYPRPATVELAYWRELVCTVVAHEWGHLLGHEHSPDPRSLMSAGVPVGAVAGCAQPAYGPGVGTRPARRGHGRRYKGRYLRRVTAGRWHHG